MILLKCWKSFVDDRKLLLNSVAKNTARSDVVILLPKGVGSSLYDADITTPFTAISIRHSSALIFKRRIALPT